MSTWSLRNLGVLALAACTSALGLDSTRLDTDRDGVDDVRDNCPTVYNPDQADRDGVGPGDACDVCPAERATHRDLDGDGIDDGCDLCIGPGPRGEDLDGDGIDDGCDPCVGGVSAFAVDDDHDGIEDGCDPCVGYTGVDIDRDGIDDSCDACLGGPPDDQDGDGIEDGCDLCPVIADPTNANADSDQLGDVCDYGPPGSTREARVLFDGFLADDPTIWTDVADPAWTITNDRIHASQPSVDVVRIHASNAFVTGAFQILARVAPDDSALGVALVDGSNKIKMECLVDSTGVLTFIVGQTVVTGTTVFGEPPPTSPYIVALSTVANDGMVHCELRDARSPNTAAVRAAQVDPGVGASVALVTGLGASGSFDWIEALRTL